MRRPASRRAVTVGLVLWSLATTTTTTTTVAAAEVEAEQASIPTENNHPNVLPVVEQAVAHVAESDEGSCVDPLLAQNETQSPPQSTDSLSSVSPNAQETVVSQGEFSEEPDELFDEEEEYDDEEDYEEEEEDPPGPGSEFGVTQEVEETGDEDEDEQLFETVSERLDQTFQYMEESIWSMEYYQQFPKLCWNQEPKCTYWAAEGECEANPDYMKEFCAPACLSCDLDPQGPGATIGKAQVVDLDNATLTAEIYESIAAAEHYVTNVVQQEEFYTRVRSLCYNRHPQCSQWAVEGFCQDENEEDFMNTHCAATCQSCETLHYETRCPVDPHEFPDIWQPGDLNKMFERLVHETPEYNVTVHSSPHLLPGDTEEDADYFVDGPWIVTIDDFITPDEAAILVQLGYGNYKRSEEVGGIDPETGEALDGVVSEDRTSRNAWCHEDECAENPVVKDIFQRIESITGVPANNSESLQLLKYDLNEFYLTHHDYVRDSDKEPGGPRILTVYMYLNDVEEGGETRFDYDDFMVKPKMGRVAIWPSVLDDDPSQKDDRTNHEAIPVVKGQKFGANAWLHLRNYQKAKDMGC